MHALNFLGVGFYLPFFPVWLGSRGLSDVDIGYVLALPILVRVFVASSVTGLGDRLRPNVLLALLNALAAIVYLALAQQTQLVPIAILTALSAVALSGVVPRVTTPSGLEEMSHETYSDVCSRSGVRACRFRYSAEF